MSAVTNVSRDPPIPMDMRLSYKATRHVKERLIEGVLFLAALVSVLTTLGIVYILVKESVVFFSKVPLGHQNFLLWVQYQPNNHLPT